MGGWGWDEIEVSEMVKCSGGGRRSSLVVWTFSIIVALHGPFRQHGSFVPDMVLALFYPVDICIVCASLARSSDDNNDDD